MTTQNPDHTYSQDELREMLSGMQKLSNTFYARAIHIGNHAFIEFCGLMNEYIKMCSMAFDKGQDFTQSNIHSGKPLVVMQDYHAKYLGEKFGCIFASSFGGDPTLIEVFIEEAFGIHNIHLTTKAHPDEERREGVISNRQNPAATQTEEPPTKD
jgi:hypothetical protein